MNHHEHNISNPTQTSRLILRQIVNTDLANIYQGLSHPLVIPYYGVSYDSLEATKEQMLWFDSLYKEQTGIWWAVCSQEDNTFYGAGGFNNWEHQHRKAEIGFWLLPDYWGQGIMKEAFPLICNYGFAQMGLHRIEGFVETENGNCKKALAKLDFKLEGTMVDCEWKNGHYISVDIYALLSRGE